jgi:hypothetical protein
MAREKPTENTEAPVNVDEGAAGMNVPAAPVAATPVAPPIHTRDRDPADREAWKRQRAAALGIPRD